MLYPTSEPQLPAALGGLVNRVHGAVLLSLEFSDGSAGSSSDAASAVGATASGVAASGVAESSASGTSAAAAAGGDVGGIPWRTGTPSGCPEALALTLEGNPWGLSPSQVLDAYGVDDLHAIGLRGEGIRMAIVENQRYQPENFATFRECFGLTDGFEVTAHETGQLAPANDAETPEAVLDLSVMSFVAPDLEALDLFMVGADPGIEEADPAGLIPFMRMFTSPLDAALRGAPAPDVVSASYGLCETIPTGFNGNTALTGIFDEVFALAAAAGITYAVSTGDDGSSACNQFASVWGELPEAAVQYPATSPYVTAVGGTNIALDGDNEIASSGVWNDTSFEVPGLGVQRAGGTGGTSVLSARPWYQEGVNNSAARTVPDVSMFADELPGDLLYTGSWGSVGGTAAAAPLFAGIVALVDQRAEAIGQPKVGFAAPLMYELGSTGSTSLRDIVLGDNTIFPEPEYGITCCGAAPGYDLATGWGSPMADTLLAELEPSRVTLTARQVSVGASQVELSAAVSGAGTPTQFRWDLDGDGTVDRTTTEATVLFDTATATGQKLTPTVVVVSTLGRTSQGATEVVLAAAATPAPLTFAG